MFQDNFKIAFIINLAITVVDELKALGTMQRELRDLRGIVESINDAGTKEQLLSALQSIEGCAGSLKA